MVGNLNEEFGSGARRFDLFLESMSTDRPISIGIGVGIATNTSAGKPPPEMPSAKTCQLTG